MMAEFSEQFEQLRYLMRKLEGLEADRLDASRSPLSAAQKDEQDKAYKVQIEIQRKNIREVLQTLLDNPPQHIRHQPQLQPFHGVANFDNSVFVMTKFPDDPNGDAAINDQLKVVIQEVRQAVEACGFKARLANDKNYHPALWDNVELYLLGCRRGIAIVEDKYLPEFNPNVAMEWGWMRGMGRNVLYLVEKGFNKKRADWSGLTEQRFDWANPGPDIAAHVQAWLKP